MFEHAYGSYLTYAFPKDELRPLSCNGRNGKEDKRGTVDDALGDYCLTLVDAMEVPSLLLASLTPQTLLVIGDLPGFEDAVRKTIHYVSFDRDQVISVFEATIRCAPLQRNVLRSPIHTFAACSEASYPRTFSLLSVEYFPGIMTSCSSSLLTWPIAFCLHLTPRPGCPINGYIFAAVFQKAKLSTLAPLVLALWFSSSASFRDSWMSPATRCVVPLILLFLST